MRILIAEDEIRMAEQLRKGLVREGYSVLLAHDGQQALDLARTFDHDMMILDWMLPKLDGSQVARRLRRAGVHTRILMLTARDEPLDIVEGLDCGADDYLIKPFAFEVLLARLRALSRRVAATMPPVLQVGGLALDPATRTVCRDGCELNLSAKEFSLLHFLMRRAGQIVPRSTLIEAVWGYDSRIESNTLDAFIHLLRVKVDASPQPKLIHTVRGVGYSLREAGPP
jgi:two-component system, OmpR family, response regulator